VVTALNADAAALTAQPLLNHADDSGTTPPTAPPTTPRPNATEQPSLVSNGGFEAPTLPTGQAFATLTAGKEPSLSAWRLTQGSVDMVAAGGAQAATGGQFIDLNGNDTAAGPGSITQDIAVTAGHTYRLSFQLAGNPNGSPAVKTLQVSFGGRKQTFTFDTTGHTNADLGWTTHTIEFGAGCRSSTVAVTFTSLTEGNRGPNLDNVVVTDVGGGAGCSAFPIWWIALALLVVAGGVVIYLYVRRRGRWAVPAEVPTAEVPTAEAPTSS
jgi:choice-of-anchor C domain-containing protein